MRRAPGALAPQSHLDGVIRVCYLPRIPPSFPSPTPYLLLFPRAEIPKRYILSRRRLVQMPCKLSCTDRTKTWLCRVYPSLPISALMELVMRPPPV